jgi:hypothetical protein
MSPEQQQAEPCYEPPAVSDIEEGQPSTVVAINQVTPPPPG